MKLSNLECTMLSVDTDGRVRIPPALCDPVDWIKGDQEIDGWLLVGGPDRCRLLSAIEVETDAKLQSLVVAGEEELNSETTNSLEFRDHVALGLSLRLQPVQLKPFKGGWRLTLPKWLLATMRVIPGKSDLAARFLHNHVEFWTIELLGSSVTPRLVDIL